MQAFNAGGDSAWTTGAAFTTDNPVTGGGSIPSFASDANAPGAALVATVSFTPGGAGGEINANVSGSHFVVAASLLAGGASGTFNATAPGATFNVLAWLVPGGASGTVIDTPPPQSAPTVGVVSTLATWPAKDPRESCAITFVFPSAASEVVVNVDVYSQYGESDPLPESIFDGSFVVNGNVVTQRIKRDSGVNLVDYYIDCVATVGGDRLVSAVMLPVRVK